ncbi:hypothetical protein [Bartonella sp. WD16.2]|uniref:hypothetical protein n=1 Tax=Bartonella sp. WD16.2 TaxID=1933904 RepID=UPI001F2F24FC|nr:hypothetical protein [Bartonella sp. WD16.2]
MLIICSNDDYPYAEFGPFEETEIRDIVDGLDNVESILRIDLYSNRYDDISEEVAELYVQKYLDDYVNYYFVEEAPYPFIAESDAYHDLLESIAEREYADATYGTYEEQHRLRPCDVLNMNYRRVQ